MKQLHLSLLIAVALALASGCDKKEPKWKSNPAYNADGSLKNPASYSATEKTSKPAVNAKLAKTSTTLQISNGDDFDWPETKIYIGGIVSGYSVTLDGLPKGASREIALSQFLKRNGERFNPDARSPMEVVISVAGYDAPIFKFGQ